MYTKAMAKKFGDFIGTFFEYDDKAIAAGLKNFMRIRVLIDICRPLKRKKNLIPGKIKEVFATFKYEKLTTFCFLCGRWDTKRVFALYEW